ncbi:MAG: glycosyltransferase family 2 protein [Candidatus Cloacimonetes bacterium]|nr:glycosyltransferase family 2 protein [Candidatus Cloacimonadota bacterium]
MELSFVLPVCNEQDSLRQLYDEIVEYTSHERYEMIFIDDGSVDGGFDVLSELAQQDSRVKVVRFRSNFGKAAALQTGFRYASGDIIISMDTDLQDNPAEIPNLLAKLDEGWDLVSGWKKKRRDPLGKRLPSKLFNGITSLVTGLKLHDFNCGFKAYRREVVEELDIYGELYRYIPALAHRRGFRVTEMAVEHRPRTHGRSKYGMERLLHGFFDLLTVQLLTRYNHSPLYLFGRLGLLSGGAGFLVSLYLSIMKYAYGMPLSNRPLLFLGMLLIMVGVQLFSIGLIGELVVNLGRRRRGRTEVSIRQFVGLNSLEPRRITGSAES